MKRISLSVIAARFLFPVCAEARVAILFIGHGEPATFEQGMEHVTFWDGSTLGPNGASLGVPEEMQYTWWAAGYSEIAEALTYQFAEGDFNGNGIKHELAIHPVGDVPPFFTWEAFTGMAATQYQVIGESPHTQALIDHATQVVVGKHYLKVDTYIGFLDSQPFMQDVIPRCQDRCRLFLRLFE